jgi:hypothetical protein
MAQTARPPKDKAWRHRRLYAHDVRLLPRACMPFAIIKAHNTPALKRDWSSVASCTTGEDDTSVHTRDKVFLLQVLPELSSLVLGIFDAPYNVYAHFHSLYLSTCYLLCTLDDGYTTSPANRHRWKSKPRLWHISPELCRGGLCYRVRSTGYVADG